MLEHLPEKPEEKGVSTIRTLEDTTAKCMDVHTSNNRNLYMHPCHDGQNQKFYWDDDWRIHSSHYGDDYCFDMEIGGTNLMIMPCHTGDNQKFNFGRRRDTEWYSLKIRSTSSHCVERNTGNQNLYLHPCHDGEHQKFYFHHRRRRRYWELGG